jgi:glucoamylase
LKIYFLIFSISFSAFAKNYSTEAFGSPGLRPNWSSAEKTHIGTSLEKTAKSPVWFTSSQGILTEVYYPTIDTAQIKDSQILTTDGQSFVSLEKNLRHTNSILSPANVILINSDPANRFSISHSYYTSPDSPILIDEMTINANVDGLKFFLLTNPHINNTGASDSSMVDEDGFTIREDQTQLKITSHPGFRKKSVGFIGSSDGYQDISRDFQMDYNFLTATLGNTAVTGELAVPEVRGSYKVYVYYSFNNLSAPKASKLKNLIDIKQSYFFSWEQYLQNLKIPSNLSTEERLLYLRSLYTLKCHEDKINRGAIIASLSVPWGESQFENPGQQVGGYHLVWPRDLFNIASALLYAGDKEAAINALRFMKRIQFQTNSGKWNFGPRVFEKAGSFPQNTWVNGKSYWDGFQIDQTAYPIHLFYHLYKNSNESDRQALLYEFQPMVVSALNFIANNGPWTHQERWEENFGISPSSFSAAASALLMGSRIFQGEYGLQLKNIADGWIKKPNDNIDTWTYTTNGVYGDGEYYLRVAGGSSYDAQWNPNDITNMHIANSTIKVDQRKVLDQGFLQLALLGITPASSEKIKKSKKIIDENISYMTPNGRGYYRYTFDSYGENSKGRLWPLLSGEHARYAIERFTDKDLSWSDALLESNQTINSLLRFANDGMMIPEQVFETTGEGTGSATPLAWAHAEYIKLIWSREFKKNIENVFN